MVDTKRTFVKDSKAEAGKHTFIVKIKGRFFALIVCKVKNEETKAKSNDVFMFCLLLTFSTVT